MTWALEEGGESHSGCWSRTPVVVTGPGGDLEVSVRPGEWHISILGPWPGSRMVGQAKFCLSGSHSWVLVLPLGLEESLAIISDSPGAATREGWALKTVWKLGIDDKGMQMTAGIFLSLGSQGAVTCESVGNAWTRKSGPNSG